MKNGKRKRGAALPLFLGKGFNHLYDYRTRRRHRCIALRIAPWAKEAFYSLLPLWQELLIAQCAQLHPQDDFPRRLSRTSEKIISPTTTTSAAQISTVGRYFATQINIADAPFTIFAIDYFVTLTSVVNLVASL